jgi:hypothetical protein
LGSGSKAIHDVVAVHESFVSWCVPGKQWDDVEDDLEAGWDTYEGRDERSTWAQVKDAVRDAWHRVTARA